MTSICIASDWDRDACNRRGDVHAYCPAGARVAAAPVSYARREPPVFGGRAARRCVHAAFGVQSPPGGVMWVPSVHKAWLEASRTAARLERAAQAEANLNHPVLLAMEREYFGRRRYRRLVALTDQVKADLVRFYNVPPEDIAVLPNGYSPRPSSTAARAETHRAAMRAKLGYGADDTVIVFVANELERKGFGPLLRAVAGLDDPHVQSAGCGPPGPAALMPPKSPVWA